VQIPKSLSGVCKVVERDKNGRYPASIQLGSLENPTGEKVKRITREEVRSLRTQEMQKVGVKFEFKQIVMRWWKDLLAFFSFNPKTKRLPQNCALYGHTVIRTPGGFEPRCRFCNVAIVDAEQLRSKV